MRSLENVQIRRGASTSADPRAAVAEIRQMVQQEEPQLILFFCSADYDLPTLATEIAAAFGSTPVIGCTTIGAVGFEGYTTGGLSAVSLSGEITAHSFAVNLAAAETTVREIASETRQILEAHSGQEAFGLLLVDGLSLMEEELASLLYRHLPRMPIVGGSASAAARFRQTHVYVDGAFHTHTAVFTLFRTSLPFRAIKFAHFVPTNHTLVVTGSAPNKRIVTEINGEPAAQVYADLIGVSVEELDAPTFSKNPLIFEMGGEQYVRSIAVANPDLSLTLDCAIENGMVLSIGRALDPEATAQAAFQRVREEIGNPVLVIGCDCILRRVEFENRGLLESMGEVMKQNQVFGFSTYGEQYDGLHINQTFTGVAIGGNHGRD